MASPPVLRRSTRLLRYGNEVGTNVVVREPNGRRKPRRKAAKSSLWNCGLLNPATGDIELVSTFKTLEISSANGPRYKITIQAVEDGMYEIDLSNRVGDLQKVYTRVPENVTRVGQLILGVNNREHQLYQEGGHYVIYSRSTWGISVEHLSALQREVADSRYIPDANKISIVAGIYRYKFALDGSHRSLARQIGVTTRGGLQFVALRPPVSGNNERAPQMIGENYLNRTNIPYTTYISKFAVHLTVDRMSAGIHLLSGLRQSALLYVGQSNMVYITAKPGLTIDDNYFKNLFKQFLDKETLWRSRLTPQQRNKIPIFNKDTIISLIYQYMNTGNIDTMLQFMDGIHDFVGARGTRWATTARRLAFAQWYRGDEVMQQLIREFTNASTIEICFREFIYYISAHPPAGLDVFTEPRNEDGLLKLARERIFPRGGSFVIDVSPISFYTTNLHLAILRSHDAQINRSA